MNITSALLFEPVEYDAAIKTLESVLASGILDKANIPNEITATAISEGKAKATDTQTKTSKSIEELKKKLEE